MAENPTLTQIQTSVTSSATSLTNLLNLAPGPTAIAGFIVDGVFRAVKLGLAIRGAALKASADLKVAIEAQSVLRAQIQLDLSLLELQSFYQNRINFVAFPGLVQFEPELLEFERSGGNPSAATSAVLSAAKTLVPAFQNDPSLSHHPELAEILILDPLQDHAIRDVVLSFVKLFPSGVMTASQHADRLGSFWKDQIVIALGAIDRAHLEAQAKLDAAVRTLVTNAVFEPQTGFLSSSLDLAKKLKKASIDEQIAELSKKKQAATTQADKDKFQLQIEKLNAHKTKVG